MIRRVTEAGERTMWSFPEGSVAHDQSVKGYAVECTDGRVGTVSWASYKPGESYLVVSCKGEGDDVHHVVPAAAAQRIDHEHKSVALNATIGEVRATPTHAEPEAQIDWDQVDQFERGMLGGGFVWPYTDV
jgi:hypothetical protein